MLAVALLQKGFTSSKNLEKSLKELGKNAFCRTCLSTENLKVLFPRQIKLQEEMSYKLNLVTGLKIQKDDEFSQKICKKCLLAIDFALDFRFKSKKAEETFRHFSEREKKESNSLLKPSQIHPYYEINTNNDETDLDISRTKDHIHERFPVEVKTENCIPIETFHSEQNDDPFDNNGSDSEEDLKPLKALKVKLKTEPLSETEPIITIKKISTLENNETPEIKYSAKVKTQLTNIKKTKKQDRMNKVATFIKVDNLPADWYGFIKPDEKEKKKRIAKKEMEMDKVKDSTIKEDTPLLIKVENLPEDMDRVPMPKVPRPQRRVAVPAGPPYPCSTCGKQYMKRAMYLAHVRFHTHYHICEQCGKRCKNPSLLRTHQRAVHGLTRIHRCAQCDYSATTKCALIVHERRHKDERPFVCDHCGAAFYTRRTLAQHVGVHMPANIQCPHCPKKCKSMKLLSNHRARKHARRYIYHCPVCPKQFNDNNAVHKHLSGYHGMAREQHPTIEKQLVA